MRVKINVGVAALLGAILFLTYTVTDIKTQSNETTMRHEVATTSPRAGAAAILEETVSRYQEEKKPDVASMETKERITAKRLPGISINESDAEILKKIAMAEAGIEGVKGKALVMAVVLNRKESPLFPDSIKEVVFQKGQFATVGADGRYFEADPDDECETALQLIKTGWNESGGALYFESCKFDSWQSKHCTYLFQYGGHRFYE